MAHFGLADAVDAAESLLDPVGVPRQVVVDHQVSALKIDAFACGIGGHQDLNFWIVLERFLRLFPLLAPIPPWIMTTASACGPTGGDAASR